MMATIIKIRSNKLGEHIHCDIFMGEENMTLVSMGHLHFRIGEWQEFGACLMLGASQTQGRIKVVAEGWSPEKEK